MFQISKRNQIEGTQTKTTFPFQLRRWVNIGYLILLVKILLVFQIIKESYMVGWKCPTLYYLEDEERRFSQMLKGREIVRHKHTWDQRAEELMHKFPDLYCQVFMGDELSLKF